MCKQDFESVKILITHMKIIHKLDKQDEYKCNQSNCGRVFLSVNSFKKHINKHDVDKLNIENETNFICLTNFTDSSTPPTTSQAFEFKNKDINKNDLCSSINSQTSQEFKHFQDILSNATYSFISRLYGELSITRKEVQNIINDFQNCFILPLNMIQKKIDTSEFKFDSEKKYLLEMCKEIDNMFINLNTEYRRFNVLESRRTFIKPEEVTIGGHLLLTPNGILKPSKLNFQFISISKLLKEFFQMKNVLKECTNYLNDLSDNKNLITNLIQCDLWKSKSANVDGLLLPILIYFDEFEVGNPLGAHAGIHKLGAVYYTLPVIPPKYSSKLQNIFLTMLFHSSDLKTFGAKILFAKLIEELKQLEKVGIDIMVENKIHNVKFKLTLIQGDNLGINTILGFVQGFRANYFCRLCKMPSNISRNQVNLDNALLRTKINYNEDLLLNDSSKSGIIESCVFNEIPSFHVTENYLLDIMHDVFEGVCLYVMGNIVHRLIIVDKIIDLDTLNFKITFFNYGPEIRNKPVKISEDNAKFKKLKMSSSEMLLFCRYFCIIIGNDIPENNDYWKLYLLLRKIIMIITSPCISKSSSLILQNLIISHHKLYLELFPDCELTPKFHFMLHLPDMLNKVGPPVHLWSMRYEGKHKSLKSIANVVASRVNISKTIAIKHQLHFCNILTQNKGFENDLVFGSSKSIDELYDLHLDPEITKILIEENKENNLTRIAFVEVFGVKYKDNDIIVVGKRGMPIFAKIVFILIKPNNNVYFIIKKCITKSFNEHLQSYKIQPSTQLACIPQKQLSYIHPVVSSYILESCYVTLKYDILD